MRNIGLTTIAISALLLSGCGGSGGGNSDPMNDKNYVAIYQDLEAGRCESAEVAAGLTDLGLRDYITRETDNTTSCATYGKVDDGIECAVEYIGTGTRNCVVGFNEIPPGYRGLTRQTTPVKLYDTMELISVNFQ